MRSHSKHPYPTLAVASVGGRSKPPTPEMVFALAAAPRLVGLGLQVASAGEIARPVGCSDDTVYAWREGRFQPRFADTLAMPSRVARRILSGALHLLDVRVLPVEDFDDLIVLLFGQLHQILAAETTKPLRDCSVEELRDQAKRLRQVHDTSGAALRQVERMIREKTGETLDEELNEPTGGR